MRPRCHQRAKPPASLAKFARQNLPVKYSGMTIREKAHALLDELPDAELDEVVELLKVRREDSEKPEMAELPAAWQHLPSGAPAPNWVAAVDEARRGY
jgi:hypothetical protein